MKVKLSGSRKPIVAITGHAGCGHCHSHNQYIQDDSGGLATTLTLLQEATGISLSIADLNVKYGTNGYFEVITESGGISRTYPRRGITLQESKLAYDILGKEAICSHSLVLSAYGRMYGQGVGEVGVSLQTAIANSAIDSFHRNYPDNFIHGVEELKGNCGSYTAGVIDIGDTPVAVMAVCNATDGGIGPNEDLEGNCYGRGKYHAMDKLNMINIPTIIVEGKVYTPLYCDLLERDTFLVRYDLEADNPFVGKALYKSGLSIGESVFFNEDIMKRVSGGMRNATKEFGEKISLLGDKLSVATTSYEKVIIVSELAELISQNAGGVTFMSDAIHEIIGGVGLMPATSAVISLLVTKEYRDKYVMPYMEFNDVIRFLNIIKGSIVNIVNSLDDAQAHIDKNGFKGDIDDYIKY